MEIHLQRQRRLLGERERQRASEADESLKTEIEDYSIKESSGEESKTIPHRNIPFHCLFWMLNWR